MSPYEIDYTRVTENSDKDNTITVVKRVFWRLGYLYQRIEYKEEE